ncbi:MAG: phosphoribosylformimino-5-aminoimidazole carboxamide ribotide isomerase [Candidatus Lambdaproteobacteria bacterium RIFOXYD1_FULL_56_27]|uniref:Phosphoribosylformimino-5-aminoimidazole carboxamide ribotide isomerase n=1 Tax=Candidatus Lambdaproteobacteria bacterium RIFOXYD2_FULL_56_26 TaxID=1817773 RepID=A0A1F6H102_9PROT|nr:MAG: phosphoribosylformimino-5-aminoimidazole carboxamide ribotide isomerase [Candidatus Lambdaproteobacteria bacterium RIFOXYC1_FULL_56_13]OGH03974.1 MAG: phosphoribosylformimino-5-aminoimidazole carboxamide ribotide isomerase [Candidatus Lambdaproteobacteria bacterium RIFOXYD2_FULL_56_26]OGH08365.1 MAG: phosphoribosylformimino-5-aminoimidazole carboxamide ribotide isomerase [Candidatus Lambdaproteobacteria bacterium RIFOXYD1_FULL_56_27]
MKFRPCIDLHQGKVKQVVGSSFAQGLVTNFEAKQPAAWFADLYRQDGLTGGHVIQLGSGNREAAQAALAAWPQGLQIGGGVDETNAKAWIEAGAAAVIVTSAVFKDGKVDLDRLNKLVRAVGKKRLVLDLSCRKQAGQYFVVTDLWTKFTSSRIEPQTLDFFARHCAEFLIHAVDVEGKGLGIDGELLSLLGRWGGHPMTYAGGVRSQEDITAIGTLGQGQIDFTVGSALDLFGGQGLKYKDLVAAQTQGV